MKFKKPTYQGAKNSTKIASCSATLSSKLGPEKSKTSLHKTTETEKQNATNL